MTEAKQLLAKALESQHELRERYKLMSGTDVRCHIVQPSHQPTIATNRNTRTAAAVLFVVFGCIVIVSAFVGSDAGGGATASSCLIKRV